VIKAILLDLGKVIIPFDFAIGYKALESRCGIAPAEIRERIRATGLVPRFETGLIEPRDFVSQLTDQAGLPVSFADFCDIWGAIFSRETLISESLLAALHRRYPLILVSNTNALHFEMIRRNYPHIRHFDALILSYEVKAMKPSPLIYESAVKAAGFRPEECFFTDDIPEYVEGARRFGIDAEQFESCAKWESDLQARGIVWDE
jgi:glucose-1-phosphatase